MQDHSHNHNHEHHHEHMENQTTKISDFVPLGIIFGYITLFSGIVSISFDNWKLEFVLGTFMGLFFLIFSLFKFLDLKGFVEGYSTYDIISSKIYAYGYIYPFIELFLAGLFLARELEDFANILTIIFMIIGIVGVFKSLLQKRQIQCACLGNVLKLPLTKISLAEDILMLIMAAVMLVLK